MTFLPSSEQLVLEKGPLLGFGVIYYLGLKSINLSTEIINGARSIHEYPQVHYEPQEWFLVLVYRVLAVKTAKK